MLVVGVSLREIELAVAAEAEGIVMLLTDGPAPLGQVAEGCFLAAIMIKTNGQCDSAEDKARSMEKTTERRTCVNRRLGESEVLKHPDGLSDRAQLIEL
jgi:hypothetical protein